MRRIWVATAMAGIAGLAGTTGYAVAGSAAPEPPTIETGETWGYFSEHMDSENVYWRTKPQTTNSADWQELVLTARRYTGGQRVASDSPITVTLSFTVSGGPVEMVVTDIAGRHGKRVLRPGPTTFRPGPASFTWVSAGDRTDGCHHHMYVRWRSPTKKPVKVRAVSTLVRFKDTQEFRGGCA